MMRRCTIGSNSISRPGFPLSLLALPSDASRLRKSKRNGRVGTARESATLLGPLTGVECNVAIRQDWNLRRPFSSPRQATSIGGVGQFSPNARLDPMRERTGKASVEAVRRAARKSDK